MCVGVCQCVRTYSIAETTRRENEELVADPLCTSPISIARTGMRARCEQAHLELLKGDFAATAWETARQLWRDNVAGTWVAYIILALLLLVLGGKLWGVCCGRRRGPRVGDASASKFV